VNGKRLLALICVVVAGAVPGPVNSLGETVIPLFPTLSQRDCAARVVVPTTVSNCAWIVAPLSIVKLTAVDCDWFTVKLWLGVESPSTST
jgi:hypothetical protein